jgi:hypothetical protein
MRYGTDGLPHGSCRCAAGGRGSDSPVGEGPQGGIAQTRRPADLSIPDPSRHWNWNRTGRRPRPRAPRARTPGRMPKRRQTARVWLASVPGYTLTLPTGAACVWHAHVPRVGWRFAFR